MSTSEIKELTRLARENNMMLKRLLEYIAQTDNNAYLKDFIINYIANKAADIY